MYQYRFSDGTTCTSMLNRDELMKRMNRLDTLRVITEPYEGGCGESICKKAIRAYDKLENFTGIIRLTQAEKDWMYYLLENEFLPDEERQVINFYLRSPS